MQVTITGATGLIGQRLVARLRDRGDAITVLTRSPERSSAGLEGVEMVGWADPTGTPAPAAALENRDAVIHLAGEPVSQRWSDDAKRRIADSRVLGTRNLRTGMATCENPPPVLISSSGVNYYGFHGSEELSEGDPAGDDFLARVCVGWEEEALQAPARTVQLRTGLVLAAEGGALQTMLRPFRLGVGGPIAGGKQYMSWIHLDDMLGLYLRALETESWSGPVNAVAPNPVTNAEFSKALGQALNRPAFMPVPGFAIKALYGEMGDLVTRGQRVVPRRALELGYEFAYPSVGPALKAAVG